MARFGLTWMRGKGLISDSEAEIDHEIEMDESKFV